MLKQLRGGFTLTELLVVIAVTGVLLALLLPAVQQAREAARRTRCANNLHQIGLALHNYHDGRGRFPPGVSSPQSGDPYPWLSWQTRLLPYIEQEPIWQSALAAYKVESSPFVDPPHTALDEVMPVYDCPSDTRSLTPQTTYRDLRVALTSYLGVIGTSVDRPDGVLFRDSRVAFKDITDGTSSTLLVGERPGSADCWFGWWYAGQGQRNTGSLDMVLGVREINLGGDYISQCPPRPVPLRERTRRPATRRIPLLEPAPRRCQFPFRRCFRAFPNVFGGWHLACIGNP